MSEKSFKICLTPLLLGHLKMKTSTERNFKTVPLGTGVVTAAGSQPSAHNNTLYTASSAILEDKCCILHAGACTHMKNSPTEMCDSDKHRANCADVADKDAHSSRPHVTTDWKCVYTYL